MRAKIYITQVDNDNFFNQKLPTWRNGFCYIERNLTVIDDPHGYMKYGEYGTIKANGKLLIVSGDPTAGMSIDGVVTINPGTML